MGGFKQQKVSIVFSDETVMIEKEIDDYLFTEVCGAGGWL